ncbi:MAG: hypothetical protein KDD73_08275 [Anaerolineales bacterium]|nr:hypothetical protein [Anaerolineales bacterium]MCB9126950.1 hypothetical protein [Ardenticatenales bacterium]MCB9171495.1 hypothetical protein [Ardenticatenales bacterium]
MRSLYGDRHNGKQEIERAIKRLNEVGLLSHLTEGEVVERCQTIQEENLSVDRLVYQLPQLTYWFDTEYLWDPTVSASYEALVSDLANISRGMFAPQQVVVTPEADEGLEYDGELLLTFKLFDHTYQQPLKFLGDWVDLRFIGCINRALAATGVDGRYYWIDTNDQCVVLIFLTPPQLVVAKELIGEPLKPWAAASMGRLEVWSLKVALTLGKILHRIKS